MQQGAILQATDVSPKIQLEQLMASHRELKARLRSLNRHVALTSAEQVEVTQLKKLKLRTKDRIRLLEQSA